MKMPFESWVTLGVSLAALMFTALSFRRNAFNDNSDNATERANMMADIRYIRTSVDDIKLEYKSMQKDIIQIRENIVKLDASVKSAHKRIDSLGAPEERRHEAE